MNDLTAGRNARRGPRLGSLTGALAAATLAVGLVAPTAHADKLAELRDQVKTTQANQGATQQEIAESQQNVNSATSRLIDSQAQLTAAQNVLADTRVQLAAARENDARLAKSLARARVELEAAKKRVAEAEAQVASQVALIGAAARESFQQQNNIRELSVVLGSESPAQLSQRLQWNTTIFDTQAAEKARLDEVLAELEAAKAAQAALEAQIAADKAESAQVVAQVAALERRAVAEESAVGALVTANQQARAAAQQELDADESQFRTLQADESRLQGEIKAEIARIRAAEEAERQRKAAEEAARRAAQQAEAARQAAARQAAAARDAAASRPAAPAPAPAPAPPAPSGPRTSSYGFVRPVDAPYGSKFGLRYHPILHYWRAHNGVDMGAPTGTPIRAAADGVVMKSGPNGGFGNFVLIGHGDLINGKYVTTGYAHQSRIVVSVGQRVQRGQVIGYVGSTGLSTAPHLHFELRLDGVPVNPVLYVP